MGKKSHSLLTVRALWAHQAVQAPSPISGDLTCLRPALPWHSSVTWHWALVSQATWREMAARNCFSGFLLSASEPHLSSGPDLGYSAGMPIAHPAHCTHPSPAQLLQAWWDHWERSLTAAPYPSIAAP